MVNSINSNAQALNALKNLSATNQDLETTTKRLSSGLKIENAKDNSTVFSLAQHLRGDTAALDVVQINLDKTKSIGNTALAAGEAISDLFIELRDKALAASDDSLDATSRNAFQEDFNSLIEQVQNVLNQAEFDGINLLNNTSPGGVEYIADAEGALTLTLDAENLTLGGPNVVLDPATHDLSTASNAQTALTAVQTSLTNINASLSRLGGAVQKIENHSNFVTRLQDVLTQGVGQLVDADLGKESALLVALQVKQQLGVQSLSIANQSPQTVLSLFQS